MGTALHPNQPTGEIHIPYQWEYANQSARESATGFVTTDLGKLARQLDDNSLWMLVATTPTWVAVGDGGAGQDPRIVVNVLKESPGTINKGQVVHLQGFGSGYPLVELARADAAGTMPALGFAYGEITDTVPGEVVVVGLLDGIDTSSFAVEDELFVSPTVAGSVQNTRPTGATSLIQKMGEVLVSDATLGQVMVTGALRVNALPNLAQGKHWVGDVDGIPQETAVFGSPFYEVSSLAESQNATITWVQKLRLTIPSTAPSGKYRVGVQYAWWHSSTTQDFEGQVEENDTTQKWFHKQEPADTGDDQRQRAAGFFYTQHTTGTARTFDLDFRTSVNGNTAAILDARLEAWKVSD